jgi:hypothetical protein
VKLTFIHVAYSCGESSQLCVWTRPYDIFSLLIHDLTAFVGGACEKSMHKSSSQLNMASWAEICPGNHESAGKRDQQANGTSDLDRSNQVPEPLTDADPMTSLLSRASPSVSAVLQDGHRYH